jgi:hypothetical protein
MCLLLLAFALFVHLFVLVCVVMAHVKNTMAPVYMKGSADMEVADASARDDVAETSSTFDQDAMEDTPLMGRGDRGSFDTGLDDDSDEDDHEASNDETADTEVAVRRKVVEIAVVVAGTGHTFYSGPSTVTERSHPRGRKARVL